MYKFTRKEKRIVEKTFLQMIDEIMSIYENTSAIEIKVAVSIPGILEDSSYDDKFYLKVDSKGASLENEFWSPYDKKYLKGFAYYPHDYEYYVMARIIKCYPDMRKQLIEEANHNNEDKGTIFNHINSVRQDLASTIEISLENSNSHRKLEISHENGETIGTIRFGNELVRIITSGSIILVDADKEKAASHQKKKDR